VWLTDGGIHQPGLRQHPGPRRSTRWSQQAIRGNRHRSEWSIGPLQSSWQSPQHFGFPNLDLFDFDPIFVSTNLEDVEMSFGRFAEDFKPLQWLTEGWNNLRDKAHNALTQFRENKEAGTEKSSLTTPHAAAWGLVASDVVEDSNKVSVRIEVPGLSRDQLKVEVQANALIVSGEKRSEATRREGNAVITERAFGHFSRVLPLPAEVDAERARAEYKDGVLAIDLPKRGATTRQSIEVG
jgi:HSP20 family protein